MLKGLKVYQFEKMASLLGLVAVMTILGAALWYQFVYHEQPCPLCLLQRAAFISVGISLCMNLRRPTNLNWALVIISAMAGRAVSIRQILLHITDVTGYGSKVMGLHMYSWGFIGFTLAILGSSLIIIIRNWSDIE